MSIAKVPKVSDTERLKFLKSLRDTFAQKRMLPPIKFIGFYSKTKQKISLSTSIFGEYLALYFLLIWSAFWPMMRTLLFDRRNTQKAQKLLRQINLRGYFIFILSVKLFLNTLLNWLFTWGLIKLEIITLSVRILQNYPIFAILLKQQHRSFLERAITSISSVLWTPCTNYYRYIFSKNQEINECKCVCY